MDHTKLFSVITTIQPPTPCVRELAVLLDGIQAPLIIIGDSAGPFGYPLAGSDFWSLERQKSLSFSLSSLLSSSYLSPLASSRHEAEIGNQNSAIEK